MSGTLTPTSDLRRWLTLDAVVTGANAVGYLVLAGWLGDHLGPDAGPLRGIGTFLLAFTALVVLAAVARGHGPARAVVAGNTAWVLVSLLAAAVGLLDLTGVGRVWVVLQAVVVAAFAVLQAQAIQREHTA